MAFFNPLAMILNQKPLDGNNFEDWKTNLYIVLVRPEKFQFLEKGQNRNFGYEIVISVKNP